MNSVMTLQFWAPRKFWWDFRPILVQKLVKMVNFGELWPKFGHLKPIRLWKSLDYPFPWTTSWEMLREAHLKDSRHKKCIFWGSRKSIWGPKRVKFGELWAKFGHLRSFQARKLTRWIIFLVYVIGNVARSSLK